MILTKDITMKKTLTMLSAMTLIVFSGLVLADDQDNLGRALKTGKDVYCNSIRDSDLKNYCQGVVKRQGVYCNSIRASKLKKECKVKAK